MKTNRSKATDISLKVKNEVYKRDNGKCIICGLYGVPNSHVLRRSRGGLGICTNIVTMCPRCHFKYDNGTKKECDEIYKIIEKYMRSIYKDWNIEDQKYKKWSDK